MRNAEKLWYIFFVFFVIKALFYRALSLIKDFSSPTGHIAMLPEKLNLERGRNWNVSSCSCLAKSFETK